MKKYKEFSLLHKYILSSAALILVSCALMGAFLLNSATSEIRSVEERQTGNRLSLIENDFNNQKDLMVEASLRISTTALYRPYQLERGAYYAIELVSDIAKYDRYSQLAESCFLMYKDDGSVYKSYAKNDFRFYMEHLGILDSGAVYEQINGAVEFTVIVPQSENGRFLFVCPVFFMTHSGEDPGAFLCFVSDSTLLEERITNVAGSFDSPWTISFGDSVISASRQAPGESKTAISRESAGFTFRLFQQDDRYSYFTWINIGFILMITVALLGFAVAVSYHNYIPIKRLVEKHTHAGKPDLSNELAFIDKLMDESNTNQKALRSGIEKQRINIAHHLLHMLFRGERADRASVDEIFTSNRFAVVTVKFMEEPPPVQTVVNTVEALSGGGITFYCVYLEANSCFAAVACFESGRRLSESGELVVAAMDTLDRSCTVGVCEVEDMPDGVMNAMMKALETNGDGSAPMSDRSRFIETMDGSLVIHITAEIKSGNRENADGYLRRYIDFISAQDVFVRCLYSELICALARTAIELNVPADTARLSFAAELSEPDAVYETLSHVVHELCRWVADRREKHVSELLESILAYINEHALDYDLDQDSVSRHFGISSNHLYRLFKAGLGDNYKHYVTDLRIKKACEYLDAGHSVTEVCGMVGYNNVSYFIKTFKNITGYTPANYKKINN